MRPALIAATTSVLFGFAGIVAAQEQTASIAGRVQDMNGGLIPGASVVAENTGGLTIPVVTDSEGRYRFHSLPPGDYSITGSFTGFAPARAENVDLRLGQELHIDITLEPAAVRETVSVVAESPLIATTQSARTTSLRDEDLRSLPNGREFTDVVDQVSGATQENARSWGNTMIDGSSAAENRFIVDGAEITDLILGTAKQFDGRSLVTDFVEEVQVKSSGYRAEYGGSTGGVINTITRSGSNVWHGDALLYWEADWLDAEPRPTLQLDPLDASVAQYVTFPKDQYHGLEPGFTLGGPILEDKLWFFGGYVPRFEPVDRTAPFSDGTVQTLHQYRSSHQFMASVTGQIGSQWRFRTALNGGRSSRDGQLQRQNGSSASDAAYDKVLVQPSWSLSASVDWTPSPDYFMSLRAGYWARDWYDENVYDGDLLRWQTSSVGLPGVPPEYQQPVRFQNVPSNSGYDREQQSRLGIQWDTTVFFTGAGQHQVKAGVQLERRTLDTLGGNTGNVHNLFWGQSFAGQSGVYGYYQVTSNPILPNRGRITLGDVRSDNVGLFVQDSWNIGDRLTLNLGLRTETENLPSFSRNPDIPATAIHFDFGDKLAPRLGFAWDATGDGKTKLYGSWGVFYDIMKLAMPLAFGGNAASYHWYTLDTADLSQIENNPRCPPECPGTSILDFNLTGDPINDPDAYRLDPDLKPMKLQEAVVGIEREIAPDLSVSARYIHKQLDRAVDDLGLRDADGEFDFWIANPGSGIAESFVPEGGTETIPYPRARRDYNGVELGLWKRMSNGWAGRFFYLWSSLKGNESGLGSTDCYCVSPNVGRMWDSVLMPFDDDGQPIYGPLATDRTHQLKAQAVYDFSFGTTVGASWFGASGIPRTRMANYIPGGSFPVFYERRESDGRMPFTSRLDLQLQHRIRLSKRTSLTLTATVFNLFNQGRPVDYHQWEMFFGQAIDVTEAEFFAGVDTQALIEEQGLARDPQFMQTWLFQPPRTIRLGARFSFSRMPRGPLTTSARPSSRGRGRSPGRSP